MPDFEITSPEGRKFRVRAPEGTTKQDALDRVRAKMAGEKIGSQVHQSAAEFLGGTAIEAAQNIPGSAAKFVGDTVRTLSDPVGSAKNAYTLGKGILQHFNIASGSDAEKYAEQVGNSILERYGSIDAALNTFKADPVGFSADLSSVLTPLAGAGRGALGTAARVTNPTTLPLQGARRVVAPLDVPQARRAALTTLQDAGVDVTAGQATGRRGLQKAEKELGGSTAEDFTTRQKEQFTRAALATAGEDAEQATTEVINRAHTRIGGVMDQLERQYAPRNDPQLQNDLVAARDAYHGNTPESLRVPNVEKAYNAALELVTNPRGMTGEQYSHVRSDLGRMARAQTKDGDAREAIYGIQHALDDAAERAIPPDSPDRNLWQEARRQYRNLKSIEVATNYAGDASGGLVTPQNLRRALQATQGKDNYSRGRGDMQGLARAGEQILPGPADSNTASRSRIIHLAQTAGVGLGALTTGAAGMSPQEMIAAMAFGYGVPRGIGEGLIRGRKYLAPNSARAIAGRMIPQIGGPSALLSNEAGRLPNQ